MPKIKIIMVILIMLAVIGVWWLMAQPIPNDSETYNKSMQETPETNQGTPSISPSPSVDVSDAALEKDMSDVDSQIINLNADATATDKGLNDKPIPQTE